MSAFATVARPLTQNIRPDGLAAGLVDYERTGGYEALKKVLRGVSRKEVIARVRAGNLKGRGGGGFSAGLKWSLVPEANGAYRQKYIVANADEMEPGTFKDRILMEGDPHLLIEGMILAGYAIGATVGYIFLRDEYRLSAERLSRAINEARESGYLGRNLLGSGFDFELHLHASAGRYICGEETALLSALEGKRAIPKSKPPYPALSGLFGKPTVVNNVETLCNVPALLRNGPDWYRSLSRTNEGGTKLYGVSGRVNNPGAWELPMGTSLREILEQHAGGMREGYALRGVIPGGASTEFLTPDRLDVAMDFESVMKAGSRLGTGTIVVIDDKTCPVGLLLNLQRFFAQESCGWCTPCRDGLPWVAKTLLAIEQGKGKKSDLDVLLRHTRLLRPGNTFCALAPGAMEPLQSALRFFRAEFEKHILERRCPYGAGAAQLGRAS